MRGKEELAPYRYLININLENERLLFSISDGLDYVLGPPLFR